MDASERWMYGFRVLWMLMVSKLVISSFKPQYELFSFACCNRRNGMKERRKERQRDEGSYKDSTLFTMEVCN